MINLEEGEYIRTKNGSIFKIIGGTPDNYDIDISYYDLGKIEDDIFDDLTTFNYNDNGNFIRDITKDHSFFAIDLVEVGDYVNGKKVIEVDDMKGAFREVYVEGQNPDEDCGLYFEQIESIVTKEQFKRGEYKVDE